MDAILWILLVLVGALFLFFSAVTAGVLWVLSEARQIIDKEKGDDA